MSSATIEIETAYGAFLDELLEAGMLVDTGVPGAYGKSGAFERILAGFDAYVTASGADQDPEVLRFPPVVTRRDFEKSGYVKSFPHLTGIVSGFHGTERDHAAMLNELESGADWTEHFAATDLVLTPAACYPVYPYATGTLPGDGRLFDVQSYCFRREPSRDPARMQSFRMHEYIRIGEPGQVRGFRDLWLERGSAMLLAVGLDSEAVVANDPFFGRGGSMLAASQRDQALKFELVVAICSESARTAVVSCNYHQDHFGNAFDISLSDGSPAHTACVGFGLERITLALLRTHGTSVSSWPATVRGVLGL